MAEMHRAAKCGFDTMKWFFIAWCL